MTINSYLLVAVLAILFMWMPRQADLKKYSQQKQLESLRTNIVRDYTATVAYNGTCRSLQEAIARRSSEQPKTIIHLKEHYFSLNCQNEAFTQNHHRVLQRATTIPSTWTCSPLYYNASDGCDCNCGAYDPDCVMQMDIVLNCDQGLGATCTMDGKCVYNDTVPSGWTCPALFYNNTDGCDCNCGISDPDCDRAPCGTYAPIFGCNQTLNDSYITCIHSKCRETVIPVSWNCDVNYYNADDGCDCNCGAIDPDCLQGDEDATYNCPCDNMQCSSGFCVGLCNDHYIGLDSQRANTSTGSRIKSYFYILNIIYNKI